jgi:hypothetical protein
MRKTQEPDIEMTGVQLKLILGTTDATIDIHGERI